MSQGMILAIISTAQGNPDQAESVNLYDASRASIQTSEIPHRPYAEMWYVNPSDFDGRCSRAIWMCTRDFKRKNQRDLTSSRTAIQRLVAQLQRVRRCLHHWPTGSLELDALYAHIDYKITFSRGSREHGCGEWDHSVPE